MKWEKDMERLKTTAVLLSRNVVESSGVVVDCPQNITVKRPKYPHMENEASQI